MPLREVEDPMEACEKVINTLESFGLDRADLPGPGDLKDAIENSGYTLAEER